MKRTIIGVMAAVVMATVGTLFLVSYVQSAEDRALAGQETVEVLVVSQDVAKGTPAEDLTDSVTTERVPAKLQTGGTIGTLDALSGRVTAVDLVPGEQLLAARFVTPTQFEEQRDVELPEGMQEVTISLQPQRAVGGRVAPGDTVGVFATFNFNDERDEAEIAEEELEEFRQKLSETSKMLLHKLLVTHVQVEQLPQDPEDGDDESSGPELAPTGNLLVTLAVDVPQAERIIFAAEHGTIWLSAETLDAEESGSLLRTPRNIYDD